MPEKIASATDAPHYLDTQLDPAANSAPECLADQHSGLTDDLSLAMQVPADEWA